MAVRVPLHWSPLPSVAHLPASSKRHRFTSIEGALTWRHVHRLELSHLSALLGVDDSVRLSRSRGSELLKCRARTSLDSFSDDEFSKPIQELALGFQLSGDQYESHEFFEPNWDEGFREVGESAYCSMKRAFSNMVFIIRELHSYTLKMREMLFYEDLDDILVRVRREMHASFVWLFQQVFSHTPTLMVYVMILLANYSVHSMAPHVHEVVLTQEDQSHIEKKFDSRAFSVSFSNGRSTSIGGSNGSGGIYRPTSGGTDDDGTYKGRFTSIGEELVSGRVSEEEELRLWNSIEEEASRMQPRDEAMVRFVSPINARIEPEDHADYSRIELLYQSQLTQEPNNTLFLANYAQFLFIVAQDYDRAEEYFKRAAGVEPKDADALNKYANFLWRARNDLWAAEQTYQAAVEAEPNNSFYAADYAHFLWNTGGEDTCFPLDNNDVV